MKKRIILFSVLMLISTLIVCSCGKRCKEHVDDDRNDECDICGKYVKYEPKYLGIKGIYNLDYEPDANDYVFTEPKEVAELQNMNIIDSQFNLVLFEGAAEGNVPKTKYVVLNSENGEVVYQYSKTSTPTSKVSLDIVNYVPFIKVVTTDSANKTTYTVEYYTPYGDLMSSVTDNTLPNVEVNHLFDDIYLVGETVCKLNDGKLEYSFDKGFKKLPEDVESIYTEKYIYQYVTNAFYVYDTEYKMIAYYQLPAGTYVLTKNILQNGNLLIQSITELPDESTEYDIFENGKKYNMASIIFDVTNQKSSEIELNYMVSAITNNLVDKESFADQFIVSNKVINIARVSYISNKFIDTYGYKYISLDNDMSLIGYMAEEIPAQAELPIPIAKNRLVVEDNLERKYLINEEGSLIGEITDAEYDEQLQLFYKDGKYYNLDLNMIYDEDDNNYKLQGLGKNYALYYKTKVENGTSKTDYYLLSGAVNMIKLELPKNADNVDYYDYFFSYDCKEGAKTYRIYCNAKGEEIFRVDPNKSGVGYGTAHSVAVYSDVMIIKDTVKRGDKTVVVYYVAK